MYFLYVDESGDVGTVNSPTSYFCLSGLVVHELKWHTTLEAIIDFRRYLKKRYGLRLREELHAAHYIHKPGEIQRIAKSLRLKILRDVIDFQSGLQDVNMINVVVVKQNQPAATDIFNVAWVTLIDQFHNMLLNLKDMELHNLHDRGMLFVDRTDEVKLRKMTRQMRKCNSVKTLIEDAVHRDSLHSYFIQLADVNAYFLHQKYEPCSYIKKKGGKNYFTRLGLMAGNVVAR